jgi:NAD(P)-dependent dehydrogenase (short-subunit alcohol dehydrogenase family)
MTGMDGAFDLRGKVALVTGGANGIGRASAKALASLGAMVVVTDVDHSGAIAVARHLGGRAIDHDVTEEDQWRGVISGIATL